MCHTPTIRILQWFEAATRMGEYNTDTELWSEDFLETSSTKSGMMGR
jgi:hypothetical protein